MCCGGCGATACIFTGMAMATARCISTPTAMPAKPSPHARAAHAHEHGFRWRTLLVGLMHGMAGSAALLVLTVSQASSPAIGLGYVALFGIGSMIGMGALSTRDRGADRGLGALAHLGQSRPARRASASSPSRSASGRSSKRCLRRPVIPSCRPALTIADCNLSQLNKRGCWRVRLTGSLVGRFNPWIRALD